MTLSLPQDLLDRLTDIAMPHPLPAPPPGRYQPFGPHRLPVYDCQALVLGSGAAGLRAAVELKRRQVKVLVATQTYFGGTSACSGSDKQTLHTACDRHHGDDFHNMAAALGAGGAMTEDLAYVEAVGSLPALATLRYLGLPVPVDPLGAVLRYQTDHDETGRATSCGPRTSRLMVKVLAEEARRLEVPFLKTITGFSILTSPPPERRLLGLLALGASARAADNPFGLIIFSCSALVLATGGPGELYRDSVYPRNCYGSLGLALESGIEAVNLTESQFGIGTSRGQFPWNLSGTYAQAMPYLYSCDETGQEYNFLADYYRTTQELASNIFRKGYQWPFHATRLPEYGSSLIDLAIFEENRQGRTVLMDFNRNPLPVPGERPFALDRLDADARTYLDHNNALLALPIDRLRQMNPLAIEIYKRGKRDLTRDPLVFTVNNQHMNGGIAVDIWGGCPALEGCYAIGEAAGTHGVTRPGGAALIAGQVFGQRCAEHIAAHLRTKTDTGVPLSPVFEAANWLQACLSQSSGLPVAAVKTEVQTRMSAFAGFVCHKEALTGALVAAQALNARLRMQGLTISTPGQGHKAVLWRQMALASEAVLTALAAYADGGGGSRGSRLLCSPEGTVVPQARKGALEPYRFLPERAADREERILIAWKEGRFAIKRCPIHRHIYEIHSFEKDWADFLQARYCGGQ